MSGLSGIIRNEVFDWLTNALSLTNNALIDFFIYGFLSYILYRITFSMVGDMYRSDVISGSLAGKVFYLIFYIINLIIAMFVLWVLKSIHSIAVLLPVTLLWSWAIAIAVEIFLIVAIFIGLLMIKSHFSRAI
jgi:hypothetical protein